MNDLTSGKWMYAKAAMFLLIGLTCAALLIAQSPTIKTVALLAIAIWAFCRAYYFAFYVIEKYVDSSYRFSGLLSFARYLFCNQESKSDASVPTKSRNATESAR